jgi:hypothetical protein
VAKTVSVTLKKHPLSREENGIVFDVNDGGAKLGQLIVSKGGLRWKPRNKRDHHRSGWKDFEKYMLGKPVR